MAFTPCEIFLTGFHVNEKPLIFCKATIFLTLHKKIYYYYLFNKKSTIEKEDFLDWVENIG